MTTFKGTFDSIIDEVRRLPLPLFLLLVLTLFFLGPVLAAFFIAERYILHVLNEFHRNG